MGEVHVRGKGRVFENPVLEALTRTNEYITFFVYVPPTIALIILGFTRFGLQPAEGLSLIVLGTATWTLVEYLMHRFLFHWVNESRFLRRFHYVIHGVHHSYPKDEGRLFMPPAPGLVFGTLFFILAYIAMGSHAFAFFPGMVLGWLLYVYTHFAIHRFKRPRNFLGYIWDHHNKHHFKHDDKAFGVSTPLWDWVFGTMPPRPKPRGFNPPAAQLP